MTMEDIKQLKVGEFGEMIYQTKYGSRVHAYGKIRLIDDEGFVIFKHNDMPKPYTLSPEKIVSFRAEEDETHTKK